MTYSYEIQVDRGFRLLEEKAPRTWRDRVNRADLNMGDPDSCILAQIFGSYTAGLEALGLQIGTFGEMRNGFNAVCPEEHRDLTEAWLQKLRADARKRKT
ncbi:hypothetical protein AB0C33_02015 [Nonomuraea sp. NPDC048881]|uniref:hypothetical protein n=1 Tax=Nonomuraea sp. NPDC048881 TaxID=3155030 RepID=UPI0033DF9706